MAFCGRNGQGGTSRLTVADNIGAILDCDIAGTGLGFKGYAILRHYNSTIHRQCRITSCRDVHISCRQNFRTCCNHNGICSNRHITFFSPPVSDSIRIIIGNIAGRNGAIDSYSTYCRNLQISACCRNIMKRHIVDIVESKALGFTGNRAEVVVGRGKLNICSVIAKDKIIRCNLAPCLIDDSIKR